MIISELSGEDKICFYESELRNISKAPFQPWFILIEGKVVSVDADNRNDVIKRLEKVIRKLKAKGKIYGK